MSVGPENIHRAKVRRGLVSCLGKTMPLMLYQGFEEKENITLIITGIHFYILKISIFKTKATNILWFSTTFKNIRIAAGVFLFFFLTCNSGAASKARKSEFGSLQNAVG